MTTAVWERTMDDELLNLCHGIISEGHTALYAAIRVTTDDNRKEQLRAIGIRLRGVSYDLHKLLPKSIPHGPVALTATA